MSVCGAWCPLGGAGGGQALVGVSVEVMVRRVFRRPNCKRVGGSAQPDPACGSGVGGKKREGKAGLGAVEVGREFVTCSRTCTTGLPPQKRSIEISTPRVFIQFKNQK